MEVNNANSSRWGFTSVHLFFRPFHFFVAAGGGRFFYLPYRDACVTIIKALIRCEFFLISQVNKAKQGESFVRKSSLFPVPLSLCSARRTAPLGAEYGKTALMVVANAELACS